MLLGSILALSHLITINGHLSKVTKNKNRNKFKKIFKKILSLEEQRWKYSYSRMYMVRVARNVIDEYTNTIQNHLTSIKYS